MSTPGETLGVEFEIFSDELELILSRMFDRLQTLCLVPEEDEAQRKYLAGLRERLVHEVQTSVTMYARDQAIRKMIDLRE